MNDAGNRPPREPSTWSFGVLSKGPSLLIGGPAARISLALVARAPEWFAPFAQAGRGARRQDPAAKSSPCRSRRPVATPARRGGRHRGHFKREATPRPRTANTRPWNLVGTVNLASVYRGLVARIVVWRRGVEGERKRGGMAARFHRLAQDRVEAGGRLGTEQPHRPRRRCVRHRFLVNRCQHQPGAGALTSLSSSRRSLP